MQRRCTIRGANEEQHTRLTGFEARNVGRANRECDNALLDAIEVNAGDGGRIRTGRFGSAFLLVGLAGKWIGRILAQHHSIDGVGDGQVRARLRKPVESRTGVGRTEQVEILATAIKHGIANGTQAIGDAVRLFVVHIVREQRRHQCMRANRICQPLRVR